VALGTLQDHCGEQKLKLAKALEIPLPHKYKRTSANNKFYLGKHLLQSVPEVMTLPFKICYYVTVLKTGTIFEIKDKLIKVYLHCVNEVHISPIRCFARVQFLQYPIYRISKISF
jgi:hypothetical protein